MGQIRTSTRLWNKQVLINQSGAKKKTSWSDVATIRGSKVVRTTSNPMENNANPISNTK
jgi:hypothetical protein